MIDEKTTLINNCIRELRAIKDIAPVETATIDIFCNAVEECVKKAEKYKWHDLRKEPEDLPEERGVVVFSWEDGWNGGITSEFARPGKDETTAEYLFRHDAIAWKYFEEFEEEENDN